MFRSYGLPRRIGYRLICLAVLLLIFASSCTTAAGFKGKVIGVTDGDTIKVLRGHTQVKIRLYGIDCPEKRQAFGTQAKKFTSQMVFGKIVTVQVKDKDRYGRTVGIVTLTDGKQLNSALVAAGMAWWYRRYDPDDKKLEALEAAARKKKIGLWSQPNPEPPWEYRLHERESRQHRYRRSGGVLGGNE